MRKTDTNENILLKGELHRNAIFFFACGVYTYGFSCVMEFTYQGKLFVSVNVN